MVLQHLNSAKNTAKSSFYSAKHLYFNDETVDWYDYGARMYDPQNTGRGIGNQAHELTHAWQVTRGEFSIGKGTTDAYTTSGSKTTFGSREEEAYKAEFSASGSVPFGASSLDEILYETIKSKFSSTYKAP